MGGAEVMASKLILALRERGHETIVVTRQDEPDLPVLDEYQGTRVYRFPFWAALHSNNVAGLLQLRQQLIDLKREYKPDLVHMNCFGPSWFIHQDAAKRPSEPLLVTLHTMPERTMMLKALEPGGLLRRALRAADWVTCVSGTVLIHTRALVPEITGYSSVVYNGLEDPAVVPAPLKVHPPRLLCVGRLIPEKGFDLALKAFARLKPAFPCSRMIIAGDGMLRAELEHQAKELGLAEAVDFPGWIAPDRIWSLLASATVVMMPSRSEGLPSVALEAGMMARPVVAARVGGIPEVVIDRKTGLLVEPENFEALANSVRLLLLNPNGAIELGNAARRRVQSSFSFDEYVGRYESLYQRLTAKSEKSVPNS